MHVCAYVCLCVCVCLEKREDAATQIMGDMVHVCVCGDFPYLMTMWLTEWLKDTLCMWVLIE